MSKVLFPSWRYRQNGDTCLVQNQDESDALGPGWSNAPGGAHLVECPATPDDEDEPVRASSLASDDPPNEFVDEVETPPPPKPRVISASKKR